MGKKTARLAGLAALAGVAYANRDKLGFGSKGKDDERPARPESVETRDENYSNEGRNKPPITSRSSVSSDTAGPVTRPAAPKVAPAPKPVESSDTNENYSNEGRGSVPKSSSAPPVYMSKTPGGDAKRTEGNQPMPSLKAVEARAASNKTDAMRNTSRAQAAQIAKMKRLKANPEAQAAEAVYPEQFLTPGGGFKTVANMAKNLANRGGKDVVEYATPLLRGPATQTTTAAPRLGGPTPQLTGPSKAELLARDRAAREAARQQDMLRENARRSGLDPDNINPAVANKVRENMGGADFSLGMKRGGAVKAKRMASGGMASGGMTASRRGDGIASRGKTRGKIC
jgi:hypothetical protein